MPNVHNEGESRSGGNATAQRVDTAALDQHINSIANALTLKDDVRRWVSVRQEGDDLHVQVGASTANGDVTSLEDVPADNADIKKLRSLLDDILKDTDERSRQALKISMARTLAAATYRALGS